MKIERNGIFLLDKEGDKPDARLRYRIRWGKKHSLSILVGYRVEIAKWSLETQRCKLSTTHGKNKIQANVINKAIEAVENKFEQIFYSFEIKGQIPTPEEMRKEYDILTGKAERENNCLFGIFDYFITTVGKQNSWSKATYIKFNSLKNQLQVFNDKLVLNELTEDILHDFVSFLHTPIAMQMSNVTATTGMKNSTIAKRFHT